MFMLLMGATVAQTLIPPLAVLGDVKPPALLALTLYYALNRDVHVMLAAAFFGGCMQDTMSLVPLGYSAVIFGATGLVAARFRDVVVSESPLTAMLFGAIAGAVTTLAAGVMLLRGGLLVISPELLGVRIIGSALLGALAAPPVFMSAYALDRLVGNLDRGETINEIGGAKQY